MTTPQEHLVDWLRDAYAMEKQAETMLKAQAARLEHYPDLKLRIEQHLQETMGQQQLLEQCLARYDASPSAMKDLMGKMAAFGQGAGGAVMSDEVVKGGLAGYVFEHTEIAMYRTLIAAAQTVGDQLTVRACESILKEEQAMATWLYENLPQTVSKFLLRSASERDDAKR